MSILFAKYIVVRQMAHPAAALQRGAVACEADEGGIYAASLPQLLRRQLAILLVRPPPHTVPPARESLRQLL